MKRRTLLRGSLVAGTGLAAGAGLLARRDVAVPAVITGPTMGTYYQVKVPAGVASDELLRTSVEAVLARIDQRMSTYRPQSELSLANDRAGAGPAALSAETRHVLRVALDTGALTGGAFDPTVGPLVDIWGFGAPGRIESPPHERALADAAGRVGLERVRLDDVGLDAAPGTRVDLSGIAKGHAVDEVARRLEALGYEDYLVDVGGELRAAGARPGGGAWRVGIEQPDPTTRAVRRVVHLERQAIATSGDYRNFFEQGGRRYAHAIDPRTALPVTHALASVTVVAADALTADALSTGLMVLGPDEGHELAAAHDIAAFFVTRADGALEERTTPAFARLG